MEAAEVAIAGLEKELRESGEATAAKVAEQQLAMEEMEQTLRQLRAELEMKAFEEDLAPPEGAAEALKGQVEELEKAKARALRCLKAGS